jgi:nucleotide-binding universal stress UspA family protein
MRDKPRILVPTDFSECARAAMNVALELARKLGGAVTLLHVYEIPVYPLFDGGSVITPPSVAAEIVSGVDDSLRRLRREAESSFEVPVELRSVEGVAHQQIVRAASEGDYDLVVMGTHGRTGLSHLVAGSVAEKVVRTSARPVLTVRHPG